LDDVNYQVGWGLDQNVGIFISTDANHELFYWSDDNTVGFGDNNGVTGLVFVAVDKTAPVTVDDHNVDWQAADANVQFSCSDALAGCRNFYYSLDDVNYQVGWGLDQNVGVSISNDGNHELFYWSDDNTSSIADNNAASILIYVAVDKTAPTATNAVPASPTETASASFTFTVDVSDANSGVQACDLNVHRADTNAIVETTQVSPSSGQCSHTYTFAQSDLNYFVAWKVFDNSNPVNYAADINSSVVARTVSNQVPDANITVIDGNPDSQVLPAFSYVQDGNLSIDFNVMDADTNNLLVDLNFSAQNTQGTGTVLVEDLNLSALPSKCDDLNFEDSTRCSWDLNIHSALVSDWNYFILILISDGTSSAFNASDYNFMVDNTAPSSVADYNLGWQNTDANITFTCSDSNSGCGLTAFRKDTDSSNSVLFGSWVSGAAVDLNAFFGEDGNWAIDFNSTDHLGNVEDVNRVFVLVDKTAPTTTDDHNAGWQSSDANVHLSCGDGSGSGCLLTKYRIDGGAWQAYDANILFASDGNFQLDYNSTDSISNSEVTKTAWVAVDKTAPSQSNIYPSGDIPSGSDATPPFWVMVSDTTSGAKGCYYQTLLNDTTWGASTYVDKNASDYCNYTSGALSDGDTLLIQWRGVDNADNNSTDQNTGLYTYSAPLSNSAPVLDINAVDGNPDIQVFPVFRYFSDKNLTIDFNVYDADNNRLTIDLNYSASQSQGTGTVIAEDLNLDSSLCNDLNFSNPAGAQCSYDFNIHQLLVSDGNYYLIGLLDDGSGGSDFNSTDKDFGVDNITQISDLTAAAQTNRPLNSGDGNVLLSWTDLPNDVSYTIFRSLDGTDYNTAITVAQNSTGYNDTGIADNTLFYYKVQANGPDTNSNVATAFTPDRTAPASGALTVTANNPLNRLDLSWTDASDNNSAAGTIDYNVYRSSDNIAFSSIISLFDGTLSYNDSGAVDTNSPQTPSVPTVTPVSASILDVNWASVSDRGSLFYYKINAVDEQGNDSNSSTSSGTVTTGIKQFYVDCTSGGSCTAGDGGALDDYNQNSPTGLRVSGLNPSTQYCFQIKAIDGADNNSSLSTQACGTTAAPPNNLPVLDINAIDGNADNLDLPIFSYSSDGNLTIDFNVFDADNERLSLDLNYSSSQSQGTGTVIVNDLNLDLSICNSTEFDSGSVQCSYDFNIHASLLSDGNYYILGTLDDGRDPDFNSSEKSFMVDNAVPDTVADYNTGWQNTDANVLFTCSDSGSGCNTTRFRKDNDSSSTVSFGSLVFGNASDLNSLFWQDGNWALDFNSIDIVGNEEDSNTIYVLIDKTSPTITDDVNAGWQSADANVKIVVSDSLSGVSEAWISKNSSSEKFTSGFDDLNALFTSDGNHSLDINAADAAGNLVTKATLYVLIDKTAPTTTADYNAGWQSADANVTFTCSDAISSCSQTSIRKDNDASTSVSLDSAITGSAGDLNAFFTEDGNWAVDFNSTDSVGNIASVERIYVLIDTNAPTATNAVPASPTTTTASSFTFTVDVSDAASGVQACDLNVHRADTNAIVSTQTVSPSGGKCRYNFTIPETNVKYFAAWRVFDNAGNRASDINSSTVLKSPSGDGGNGDGGDGSTGAGPSGGTGAPPTTVSSTIHSWDFEKTVEVGEATPLAVTVSNTGGSSQDFLLSVKIIKSGSVEFSTQDLIEGLQPGETREIVLSDYWVPTAFGNYQIEIKLFLADGTTLVTTFTESFIVTGKLRYDVDVECLDKLLRPDSTANASITLLNLGDFYQDVDLIWRVEDPNQKVIETGSIPVAVQSGESRNFVRAALIPAGSALGVYSFLAEVVFGEEKRQGKCSFSVVKDKEYYEAKLEILKAKLNELDSLIQTKKSQGIITTEIESRLKDIGSAISEASEKIVLEDFTGLDERLAKIEHDLNMAEEEAIQVKEDLFSKFVISLLFPIAALILLVMVLISLFWILLILFPKTREKIAMKGFKGLDEEVAKIKKNSKGLVKQAKEVWETFSEFVKLIASLFMTLILSLGTLLSLILFFAGPLFKALPLKREGKIKIKGYSFKEKPFVGKTNSLKIKALGTGIERHNIVFFVEITRAKEIEFSASDIVKGSEVEKTKAIALGKRWTPSIAGPHKIEIKLIDAENAKTHAKLVKQFGVGGKLNYAMALECLEKTVKAGNNINALIRVSNAGHYDEDISLEYWVDDSNNVTISKSSEIVELEPSESKNIVKRVRIPKAAAVGVYYFNAEISYGKEKKQAKASFSVEALPLVKRAFFRLQKDEALKQSHEKSVGPVQASLEELNSIIQRKKSQGFATRTLEKRMRAARRRASKAAKIIKLREFKDLDKVIMARVEKEIKVLLKEAEFVEKKGPQQKTGGLKPNFP
jgi:hypothetical protein